MDYGDLRFGVLTSETSFSCGNLLPSTLADAGVVLMGERSGGGSCAVENGVTADGVGWEFSSWRARLTNEAGHDIDDGVPVDVDLLMRVNAPSEEVDMGFGKTEISDYHCFYEIELLSEVMNEYYGEVSLPAAA